MLMVFFFSPTHRYLALESMCLLATSEFSHDAVKKHQETVVTSLKVGILFTALEEDYSSDCNIIMPLVIKLDSYNFNKVIMIPFIFKRFVCTVKLPYYLNYLLFSVILLFHSGILIIKTGS